MYRNRKPRAHHAVARFFPWKFKVATPNVMVTISDWMMMKTRLSMRMSTLCILTSPERRGRIVFRPVLSSMAEIGRLLSGG
jgi:hypothetical protein